MKLGVMQPYFFPYIGYWQLLAFVDEYIIYDDVNYIKRGWMNRNHILVNGQKHQINLHIKKASQNRLIKDTEISQTEQDNEKLLATIKMGYHKAPYYDTVYDLLKRILYYDSTNLAEFLHNQLSMICNYLGIDTKLVLSSSIEKDNTLRGEDKIIEICKKRSASHYINAIGGRELYHHERFQENQIQLNFLETIPVEYLQFGKPFVSNLSIIDVMMFNDVHDIQKILNSMRLVE